VINNVSLELDCVVLQDVDVVVISDGLDKTTGLNWNYCNI